MGGEAKLSFERLQSVFTSFPRGGLGPHQAHSQRGDAAGGHHH